MSEGVHDVVPFQFDLSDLVRRSVASLYSHLITRPTGQALRLGIESQIGELGTLCLSVLDFSDVRVLDFSCADEAVAKLILRYQRPDRPADAYFVARGVGESHRGTLEAVLERHDLALVVDRRAADEGVELLGTISTLEREAWDAIEELEAADLTAIARRLGTREESTLSAVEALAERRVIVRRGGTTEYVALSRLIEVG